MRYTPEAVAERATVSLNACFQPFLKWVNIDMAFQAGLAYGMAQRGIKALAPHTDGALIDVAVCIAKRDVDSPYSEFALKVSMGHEGGLHNFQALTIVVTLDGKVEIDTRDCYGPVIDALKEVAG